MSHSTDSTDADSNSAHGPGAARHLARLWPRTRPVTQVFDLTRPEQLLLWSARRWRHGRFGWPQVEVEFRRVAGARWADALIAWEQALDLLHRWPASTPDIRNGCETALSADERALLSAVAVVQAGPPLAPDLLLRRLAGRFDRMELLRLLEDLADAFGAVSLRDARPSAAVSAFSPPQGHRSAG